LFYFFRLPPVSPFNSVSIRQLTIDDNVVIAAISPDGNFVVYATEKDGRQSLWVRQVAATGGKEIVEPADVEYTGLTFSPDGNFVYFVRGRTIFERQTLYQIPAFGGATRKLFDDVRSAAAVSPDGKRIAFVRGPDLILANADGTGEPQILATRKPPEEFFLAYWDSGLDWSPDGKTIAISGGDTHKIKEMYPILVNVADGTQTLLTKNGWQGVGRVTWLADGSGIVMNAVDRQIDTTSQLWHVSYPGGAATRIYNDFNGYDSVSLATNSDTLAAVQSEAQTNLRAINPSEEAGKITDLTVGKGRNDGYWQLATAPDGRIVFDSKAGGEMELWIMDADGGNQKQLNAPKAHEPTVSPDASRIVFNARAGIWQMEIDGSNQRELTKTGMFPYYSPDGQWIFYTGPPRGFRLWKMRSDGSEPTQVTDYPAIQPAVSPDGKMIAFMALTGKTEAKLKIIRIEGGETVREFEVVQLRRPFQIEWTHGGTAVNYNGFSDGVEQIWNLPLDGSPPRVLFETKTGQIRSFTWSPDGKRLYFGSGPVSRNVVIFSLSR
jgi:Tol biopolymer transport system component